MSLLPGVSFERSDRVFIVGTTGSGKTVLVKLLLLAQPHIAILDPKRRFTWGAAGDRMWAKKPLVTEDLQELTHHKGPHPVIYRPSLGEMETGCNTFFSWAYSRGGTLVYVDEAMPIVKPTGFKSPMYQQCLQLGRELEVGVWTATQRPARIPLPIVTEAEHDFIFRLRAADDRKRMADYTDPKIKEWNPTDHSFWYYRDGSKSEPQRMKVNPATVKKFGF